MKYSIISLLTVAVVIIVTSCSSSGSSHALYVLHPNPYDNDMNQESGILFADETLDSVVFLTMDSWVAQSEHPSWLLLGENQESKMSGTIKNDGISQHIISLPVTLKTNDTPESRISRIFISSDDMSVTTFFAQLHIFDYKRPNVLGYPKTYRTMYNLQLCDSSFISQDSICFTVRKDWTMEIEQDSASIDWMAIDKESGNRGYNVVKINFLKPNMETLDRHGYLKLCSSGVTNRIKIIQYATPTKE